MVSPGFLWWPQPGKHCEPSIRSRALLQFCGAGPLSGCAACEDQPYPLLLQSPS